MIVICKHCKRPEYWSAMRWKNGTSYCRSCYKREWEAEHGQVYRWGDLDGPRPTEADYQKEMVLDDGR